MLPVFKHWLSSFKHRWSHVWGLELLLWYDYCAVTMWWSRHMKGDFITQIKCLCDDRQSASTWPGISLHRPALHVSLCAPAGAEERRWRRLSTTSFQEDTSTDNGSADGRSMVSSTFWLCFWAGLALEPYGYSTTIPTCGNCHRWELTDEVAETNSVSHPWIHLVRMITSWTSAEKSF